MDKTWSIRLVITSCSDVAEMVDGVGSGAGGVTEESEFESHCGQELPRTKPTPSGWGSAGLSSFNPPSREVFKIVNKFRNKFENHELMSVM